MPYVYILRCSDGSYYTGSTYNLERRLAEHNAQILTDLLQRDYP
ncbi:MAG: GIY-YIG nuclease family protein [Nitrospirae bacterium]|nr:GIY-YIG nuclease family protein [Nitrospirota bacterium]